MTTTTPPAAAALLFVLLLSSAASRPVPLHSFPSAPFAEAPQFRDGDSCPPIPNAAAHAADFCDPSSVHIAMTLDSHYLRGSVAAVYSLLKHASCPDHLFFHFIASANATAGPSADLSATIRATFPSLRFALYPFSPGLVLPLISPSVRSALDNPLNYARNYLASILPPCVHRVVYLDSDIVAADDIARLWETSLPGSAVIAAPEYCHANFTRYFSDYFWANWGPAVFSGRRRPPCYFNTGVMVMDLRRWREGGYERLIEWWMEVQREERIYDLGSLPPFLLVFAGDVEGVDHRWNQHGLGGDNVSGSCRPLHPGPASLLHWSGQGKPWDRLDAGRPCPVDHLWAPYDLYIRPSAAASSLW